MRNVFKNRCTPYAVSALKTVVRFFEPFIYPLKCLNCGIYIDPDRVEPHTISACFCDTCMALGFFPIESPFCTKCGIPFHTGPRENHVCGSCLKTPLMLDRVRGAVAYKGIIKNAIPLFKYHSKLSVATVFERLLFEAFVTHYHHLPIDLVMPIPLHRQKLRKRGFNQAFLLIRHFAKQYQQAFGQPPAWEIDTICLVRIKPTQPQTGFDMDQRKANVKDAFAVVNHKAIENRHILLIDDVFTTGTTCNEAAGQLLKHGARKVDALVLARA